MQGDVCKVVNASGTVVASYTYDAWGKVLTATGSMAEINPIRYRGYYYDQESGLYYLNSRYYDPEIGRFINADGYVSTGQGVLGNNMFTYCGNNPVMYSDPTGESALWILLFIGGLTIAGGIWGFCQDEPLGANYDEDRENEQKIKEDLLREGYELPDHYILGNSEETKLTTGDRLYNAFIGASLGMLVGGALVSVYGVVGSVFAGTITTTAGMFGGLTGAQTFAWGALSFNVVAMVCAPFMGTTIDPIEWE